MSVIPFVLNGNNLTVVTNRELYEKAGGINGEVIFIQNFDEEQVSSPLNSNASYDLRVGSEYRDHRDSGKTDLRDNEYVVLNPGAAVIIETAELVQFPKYRFGHIVPKVSLLQRGLSNTSSKIDPGYEGNLLVTVFNLGKQTERLKKGQKFCTLYVLDVTSGVVPYQKQRKRITGEHKERRLEKFWDEHDKLAVFALAISILLLLAEGIQAAAAAGIFSR